MLSSYYLYVLPWYKVAHTNNIYQVKNKYTKDLMKKGKQ